MIPLMEFKQNARDWLQQNLEVASNYGAILPPVLEKEGVDWQKNYFMKGGQKFTGPKNTVD